MTRPITFLYARRLLALKLMVAVSLSVYFFFLMLPVVMPRAYDGNCTSGMLFTRLSRHPITNPNFNMLREFPIFETRAASQLITGSVCNWFDAWVQKHFTLEEWVNTVRWNNYFFWPVSIEFGLYQSGWLVLLFGLFLWYRHDALLLMFGTFAGLMYNLTIPSGSWWYPWDMPSLALFTWAILVFLKDEYWPLVAVAFLASTFKETGLMCGWLVVLGPWGWRKRLLGGAALLVAFIVTRKLLMFSSGATVMLLPLNEAYDGASLVANGLHQIKPDLGNLFAFHLNNPFFANCGLLFVMLFLPARLAVKAVIAAFMLGQLIAGSIFEFRVWFEFLPLGLMQLSDFQKEAAP